MKQIRSNENNQNITRKILLMKITQAFKKIVVTKFIQKLQANLL